MKQSKTTVLNKLEEKRKNFMVKAGFTLHSITMLLFITSTRVYAVNSNTTSIDGFIDFVCDWLAKIGGVVALVGGVLFALGWNRDDADGKSRGLMTLMAGFMLVAISQAPDIFGL